MRRPILALLLVALTLGACGDPDLQLDDGRPVRILTGERETLDPAAQGDAGSAAVTAQLFETLTTFDADLELRPALAESWTIAPDGRQVTFRLRSGLTFSDGEPIRPSDVRRSWLRVIDPAHPSPLATLALDIVGASAYIGGTGGADAVAIEADDAANEVVVDLVRPAADFVSIVTSPTFSIVPAGVGEDTSALEPGDAFVSSGGYVLTDSTDDRLILTANDRYWAGRPAIGRVELVGDLGGASPVETFEDGDLDYTSVSHSDASWLPYDERLGPQLVEVAGMATEYLGFTTDRPPFDDVRVRQAFARAVDWRRITALAGTGQLQVATSMVPPGIPGRSDVDYLPPHDPDGARALLAAAGYPGGQGFPDTVMMTGAGPGDEALIDQVQRELGITIRSESLADGYFNRLHDEPPAIWSLSWIADYPGRNDFLGVLLQTGATNNYGRWSSAAFDAAIADAIATTDPATAAAAFDRAEAMVRDEVPVVPLAYSPDWALSRTGLLGAGQNGLGSLRMAGMAWAD